MENRIPKWGILMSVGLLIYLRDGFAIGEPPKFLWGIDAFIGARKTSRAGIFSFRPVAFSPDGTRIVVCNVDMGARIADARTGTTISSIALGLPVFRTFSSESMDDPSKNMGYPSRNDEPPERVEDSGPVIMGYFAPIRSVIWHGEFIVFVSNQLIIVWSEQRGRILYTVTPRQSDFNPCLREAALSSKGLLAIATEYQNGERTEIEFFETATGKLAYSETIAKGYSVSAMGFRPDGNQLFICGWRPCLMVVDMLKRTARTETELEEKIYEAVYHRQTKSIIVSHGYIWQWFETALSRVDLESGKVLASCRASEDISPCFGYAVQADILVHFDREVNLVFRDGESLKEICRYPIENRGQVSRVQLSPRGDLVAICYSDSSVAIYAVGRLHILGRETKP